MGRQSSSFSLPGFARLAPSIYVQDSRLSAGDYPEGQDPSYPFSSGSSFSVSTAYAAKSSSRGGEAAPPDLIIVTSWTCAAAKHVAKYTQAYNSLYPGVPILVITTVLSDLVLRSIKNKLGALEPAVAYLLSKDKVSSNVSTGSVITKPRFAAVLLHAFSEGGAHKAVLLARAYRAGTGSAARLPLGALILDSTPGRPDFGRAATAFARALPSFPPARAAPSSGHPSASPPLPEQVDGTCGSGSGGEARPKCNPLIRNVLAPSAVALALALSRVRSWDRGGANSAGDDRSADGRPDTTTTTTRGSPARARARARARDAAARDLFIDDTRRALNDETLWDVRRAPRAYLFSERDEVVWWRDVHDHAVESAAAARTVGTGAPVGPAGPAGPAGVHGADVEMAGMGPRGNAGGYGVPPGAGCLVVRFRRTEHCAHARGQVNGAVYWAAVRKTWEMREDGGLGLKLGLGRRLSLDSLCCNGEEEA